MLQSSGNSRRVRKGLGLQHPFSSESCRSSTVDHDEEMTLESPRQAGGARGDEGDWVGRRREEEKKMHGGWSQKGKRRCRRPESDGVEGIYVDCNGEGHHEREQVENSRRQSDVSGEEGEEIKKPEEKSNSGRI